MANKKVALKKSTKKAPTKASNDVTMNDAFLQAVERANAFYQNLPQGPILDLLIKQLRRAKKPKSRPAWLREEVKVEIALEAIRLATIEAFWRGYQAAYECGCQPPDAILREFVEATSGIGSGDLLDAVLRERYKHKGSNPKADVKDATMRQRRSRKRRRNVT